MDSNSNSPLGAIIVVKLTSPINNAIFVLLQKFHVKLKTCVLQWISSHVNIEGNECAYLLAKEAWN